MEHSQYDSITWYLGSSGSSSSSLTETDKPLLQYYMQVQWLNQAKVAPDMKLQVVIKSHIMLTKVSEMASIYWLCNLLVYSIHKKHHSITVFWLNIPVTSFRDNVWVINVDCMNYFSVTRLQQEKTVSHSPNILGFASDECNGLSFTIYVI